MNCEEGSKSILPYYYGELPPDEEERVEEHLDTCESCRRELERQQVLASVLDRRAIQPPDALLEDCRDALASAVRSAGPPLAPVVAPPAQGPSVAERLTALWTAVWSFRQPIGAVALLLLGYFSAQIVHGGARPGVVDTAAAAEPLVSRVRSVQPDSSGHVQISLDEVRQKVVSGRLDDSRIQQLLLAAARDENDAGVRVESVGILKDHAASAEVRGALLNALAHDTNPGVRLKALEGLKSFAGDAQVRQTLTQLLLTDDNPGVRIQAIDMLTSSPNDSVVGVLQNVVGHEDNDYVRWRCEKALKDMNASVGTF